LPSTQASPLGHCVAQSPQCLGSFDGSKQPPPPGEPPGQQTWFPVQVGPPLQVQAPPWHASPILHTWLHAPQLVKLWLTQLPPQQSCPSLHGAVPQTHWPLEQTSPARHFLPQAPQLLGSLSVLAQPEVQHVSLAAQMVPLHAQAPSVQVSGAAQAWPQLPQFALSVLVSAQVVPPQQTVGKLHVMPPPQLQLPDC